MDASEPRVRHRGHFLRPAEISDGDPGGEAAAEGVTIRARAIRPQVKRRATGVMKRTTMRPSQPGDRHPASRRHSP